MIYGWVGIGILFFLAMAVGLERNQKSLKPLKSGSNRRVANANPESQFERMQKYAQSKAEDYLLYADPHKCDDEARFLRCGDLRGLEDFKKSQSWVLMKESMHPDIRYGMEVTFENCEGREQSNWHFLDENGAFLQSWPKPAAFTDVR